MSSALGSARPSLSPKAMDVDIKDIKPKLKQPTPNHQINGNGVEHAAAPNGAEVDQPPADGADDEDAGEVQVQSAAERGLTVETWQDRAVSKNSASGQVRSSMNSLEFGALALRRARYRCHADSLSVAAFPSQLDQISKEFAPLLEKIEFALEALRESAVALSEAGLLDDVCPSPSPPLCAQTTRNADPILDFGWSRKQESNFDDLNSKALELVDEAALVRLRKGVLQDITSTLAASGSMVHPNPLSPSVCPKDKWLTLTRVADTHNHLGFLQMDIQGRFRDDCKKKEQEYLAKTPRQRCSSLPPLLPPLKLY